MIVHQKFFQYLFISGLWLKSVIEGFFGDLVNCGLSELDGGFWVESVMKESNKLLFRWYEFLFRFNQFIILSFCGSISILSFKNSLLIDSESITLTISLCMLFLIYAIFGPLICFIAEYILWSKWFNSNFVAIVDLLIYATTRLLTESYKVWWKLSGCHTN